MLLKGTEGGKEKEREQAARQSAGLGGLYAEKPTVYVQCISLEERGHASKSGLCRFGWN